MQRQRIAPLERARGVGGRPACAGPGTADRCGNLHGLGRVPLLAFLLLVLVLAVAAAGLSMSRHSARQQGRIKQLRREVQSKQGEIAELQGLLREQTEQVETLQQERKDLSDRVEVLRVRLSTANTELKTSRTSLNEINARYGQLMEERRQVEAELTDVTKERTEATQGPDGQVLLKAFLKQAQDGAVNEVASQLAGGYGRVDQALQQRERMRG